MDIEIDGLEIIVNDYEDDELLYDLKIIDDHVVEVDVVPSSSYGSSYSEDGIFTKHLGIIRNQSIVNIILLFIIVLLVCYNTLRMRPVKQKLTIGVLAALEDHGRLSAEFTDYSDPNCFAEEFLEWVYTVVQELEAEKDVSTLMRVYSLASSIFEDAFAYSGDCDDELCMAGVCTYANEAQNAVERSLDAVLFCPGPDERIAIERRLRSALNIRGEEQENQLISAICMWEQFTESDESTSTRMNSDIHPEFELKGAELEPELAVAITPLSSSLAAEARRKLENLVADEEAQLQIESQFSKEVQQQALLSETESLRDALSSRQASVSASVPLSQSASPQELASRGVGLEELLNVDDGLTTLNDDDDDGNVDCRTSDASVVAPFANAGRSGLKRTTTTTTMMTTERASTAQGESATFAEQMVRGEALPGVETQTPLGTDDSPVVVASLIAGVHGIYGRVFQDLSQRLESRKQLRKQTWARAREFALSEWHRIQEERKHRRQKEFAHRTQRKAHANERAANVDKWTARLLNRRERALISRRRLDGVVFLVTSFLAVAIYVWALVGASGHESARDWIREQVTRLCACIANTEDCAPASSAAALEPTAALVDMSAEEVQFMSSAYHERFHRFTSEEGSSDWTTMMHSQLMATGLALTTPLLNRVDEAVLSATVTLGRGSVQLLQLLGMDFLAWEFPLLLSCGLALAARLAVFLIPLVCARLVGLGSVASLLFPPALAIGLWRPLAAFFDQGQLMMWLMCAHATLCWLLYTVDTSLRWQYSLSPRPSPRDVAPVTIPPKTSPERIRFWRRRIDVRAVILYVGYPLLLSAASAVVGYLVALPDARNLSFSWDNSWRTWYGK